MQRLPVPVIARVHGTAAGCQLVAMCDLAVASRDARFAVSGVNLGSSAPRRASRSAATSAERRRSRCSSRATSSPPTRRTRGLVNRVAAPEELDAEVERPSPASSLPRAAIALGKALHRQLEAGIAAAYDDAGRTMACNMMDEAALEGVQAFIEKRKPAWG